jgi:hypothetical protein
MCPFTLIFYVLAAVLGLGGIGGTSLSTLLSSLLGGAAA